VLRLRAPDGFELGAVLWEPAPREPSSGAPVRHAVVLHGGAGIAAARYRHFAAYLAEHGVPVLTYDYRGIGMSRPASLRGFAATVEDWSEYDSAAAVAALRSRFPSAGIVGLAHSVGALLFGGAANAAEQSRLLLVSGHTGYYGDYDWRYRLPMAAVWHVVMPGLARLAGYFPASRLGLGEDLPAGIALQWAGRWSGEVRPAGKGPDTLRTHKLLDRCAALARPAVLVSVTDDAFATPRSTERLLSYYPRLAVEKRIVFSPADAATARIGHFGLFSRRGAVLWPRLLAEIQAA
jgi:predicted alpha/beta hydrolase